MSNTLNIRKIKKAIYEQEGQKILNSELAERLGVSPQQITNWTTGRNSPKLDSLLEIQKMSGLRLDEMIIRE